MSKLRSLANRLFPERQIFLRTEGRVRYLRLPRGVQIATFGLGLAGFGWALFASLMYLEHNRDIAANEAQFERQQFAFETLLGDVAAYQAKIANLSRAVKERQTGLMNRLYQEKSVDDPADEEPALIVEASEDDQAARDGLNEQLTLLDDGLKAITDMGRVIKRNLAVTAADLEAAVVESNLAATAHLDLWERLRVTQEELRQSEATIAVMRADLDTTKPRLEAAVQQRVQAVNAWHELQGQYASVQEQVRREMADRAALQDRLAVVSESLEQATDEKSKVAQDRKWLRLRAKDLEQDLKAVSTAQQRVLARLSRQAAGRIERLERIVDLTGVDSDVLTATPEIASTGRGGPFIPAGPIDQTVDLLASAVATLDLRLDRWRELERLMRRLPLAIPVNSYYVSSPYGLRKDPYTRKWSMHRGVDLAGMLRSPIYATAPGVVTKAGTNGPNGKMVEIDHGMDIRTRYGHLSRILVKKGDKVDFRTRIALMGSTGRSTGPHLHYEIWADGRTYDPIKFIKAGRYSLQDVPTMKSADMEHPIRPKPNPRPRS